jgi:hypothetical protein
MIRTRSYMNDVLPVAAVDKVYNPSSAGVASNTTSIAYFYSSVGFLGHFKPRDTSDGTVPFLQKIVVKDNKGQEAVVVERDYPDCVGSRFVLVNKNSRIYLVTTDRMYGYGHPTPISEPLVQLVTIYILSADDGGIPFFKQKSQFKSKKAVCSNTEARNLLKEVITSNCK